MDNLYILLFCAWALCILFAIAGAVAEFMGGRNG
jgi:hypothetical protein